MPLPAPSNEELSALLQRIVRRTAKAIVGFEEDLGTEGDALAALQPAEVDRRLRFPDPFPHARRSAFADGFSLHAGVRIHANDRAGLERLCRYAVRPPFSLQRLSRGEEGRLVYQMKRPRGGSRFLLLTPDELLARLATLVPPPRVHGLRYHGVSAPNSKVRSRVVPARTDRGSGEAITAGAPERSAAPSGAPRPTAQSAPPVPTPAPRSYRVPWADLLRKVFAVDVLECPDCGGRLRVLAFMTEASAARRILDHLGLDSRGPPLARAQAPPELLDPGPDYGAADPAYFD